MFTVKIEYPASKYPALDEVIRSKLNKHSSGSGMGFGVRDQAYCFKTGKAAVNAFLVLKDIFSLTKLSLEKDID